MSRGGSVEEGIAQIAGRLRERFPAVPSSPRTVGREAELPLVEPDGRAGDTSRLWPMLLREPGARPVWDQPDAEGRRLLVGVETDTWVCTAEVGRATLKVGVGPAGSLFGLADDLAGALAAANRAARACGYRVLGYGIQPRTPGTPSLMTPKVRYEAFLRAVGSSWLLFTVTASDQLHVHVGRDELVPVMNAMNAASGAIIALTANSSVYRGRPGAYASGREGLMRRLVPEPFRHGAVPGPFRDLVDFVTFTTSFRCLVQPDGAGGFRLPDGSFARELARRGPDLDAYLFHEHYLWPSARPRSHLGTIEIRPACQQPEASFAAAAFSLGLVESHPAVEEYLRGSLGPGWWEALLSYRRRAIRSGPGAGEPVAGLLARLVELAEAGLAARGQGEERLLAPIRERLVGRTGPADVARELFRDGGVPRLIDELALG